MKIQKKYLNLFNRLSLKSSYRVSEAVSFVLFHIQIWKSWNTHLIFLTKLTIKCTWEEEHFSDNFKYSELFQKTSGANSTVCCQTLKVMHEASVNRMTLMWSVKGFLFILKVKSSRSNF